MNRQQTNLFIADTSCGGDFLILPKTRPLLMGASNLCRQEFSGNRVYRTSNQNNISDNRTASGIGFEADADCGSAVLSLVEVPDGELTAVACGGASGQRQPAVPQSHRGVGEVIPANAVIDTDVLVETP